MTGFRPLGAVIWEDRPRRWWHRVIWWKRPRAVWLPAGQGGQMIWWWGSDGKVRLKCISASRQEQR